MNRKATAIVVMFALLMMLTAVAPVLAFGPLNAEEVGNNPNLTGDAATGIAHMDAGKSSNTFMWINSGTFEGMIFHDEKTTIGAGRMNNVIVVTIATLMDLNVHPELYYNKWMFFSGETNGPTFMGHGMLYLFAEKAFGAGSGAALVAEHPDGVFATWHFVGGK